jgi:hypothetical protein
MSFGGGGGCVLGCTSTGVLSAFSKDVGGRVGTLSVGAAATAMASCCATGVVAVGTADGYVRLVDAAKAPDQLKTVHRARTHSGAVAQVRPGRLCSEASEND